MFFCQENSDYSFHIPSALPELKVQKQKTDKAAELPACKNLAKNHWKSNRI